VPPHALDTLRSRGVLMSLGRGVDRLRDHPFDHWAQCQAALDLAGPGAVLGLRSAARLHSFYAYRHAGEVEVIVERGRDARISIGRIVQTRSLPPQHVTAIQGFPVTTVARTFFDLCGDPDPGLRRRGGHPVHETKMARVYNDAAGRRGLTLVQELAVLAALAQRGRRGTVLVRRLLLRFGRGTCRPDRTPKPCFSSLSPALAYPSQRNRRSSQTSRAGSALSIFFGGRNESSPRSTRGGMTGH
jgi:hypothetical protein